MKLPPYIIFPVLEGEKVTLREVCDSDIQDLMEISCYDSIPAKNLEEAKEMQERIDKDYEEGNTVHWMIIDNASGKIVGTCGYYRGFENESGELGFILLAGYRGQGFMTAAIQLAIDFGKKDMELKRIRAATNRKNEKCIAVLERLNFIKIAILPDDEIEYEYRTDNS